MEQSLTAAQGGVRGRFLSLCEGKENDRAVLSRDVGLRGRFL